MQGVSQRALKWYSECYCLESDAKTFAFKGVQTIHRLTSSMMDSLYAFECKRVRSASHTVTFSIPL
jgi:hypothetical protein